MYPGSSQRQLIISITEGLKSSVATEKWKSYICSVTKATDRDRNKGFRFDFSQMKEKRDEIDRNRSISHFINCIHGNSRGCLNTLATLTVLAMVFTPVTPNLVSNM